jgi:hypothetical protein
MLKVIGWIVLAIPAFIVVGTGASYYPVFGEAPFYNLLAIIAFGGWIAILTVEHRSATNRVQELTEERECWKLLASAYRAPEGLFRMRLSRPLVQQMVMEIAEEDRLRGLYPGLPPGPWHGGLEMTDEDELRDLYPGSLHYPIPPRPEG